MREDTVATKERRGSKAAVLPLGLLAAAFVMPSVYGGSAAQHAAYFGLWVEVVPVFLFAGLFTFLTGFALWRRQVDRGTRRLALASLAAMALLTVGDLLRGRGLGGLGWVGLAITLVAAAGAAVLVRRARGLGPWQVWEHLLAAFAVLSAGTFPTVYLGLTLLNGEARVLRPGAYLYLGALVALWALGAVAVVRARRLS